jgi:hypothetical protein
MLDDKLKPTASEFVDFTYYGEVILAGLELPPRDVEEPRLLTLTDDTARTLSDKNTQAANDDYPYIGCYAFFDSRANAAISEGFDALSNSPPLSPEQVAAVVLNISGNRTQIATEEAARARLSFLRPTKSGQPSSQADRVFAELAHERLCRPRLTAVYGPLDALRQAFIAPTLEVSLHAANKAAAGATFASVTPDKPAKRLLTNARQHLHQRQPHAPLQLPRLLTRRGPHKRNYCVARRADSCSLSYPFIRHRVRRR